MNRGDGFFFGALIVLMLLFIAGLGGNLPGQCEGSDANTKMVCVIKDMR